MAEPSKRQEKETSQDVQQKEKQKRVRHLYKTMQQSLEAKHQEEKIKQHYGLMDSWQYLAAILLAVIIFIAWKVFD